MQSQLYAAKKEMEATGNYNALKDYEAFVKDKIAKNW